MIKKSMYNIPFTWDLSISKQSVYNINVDSIVNSQDSIEILTSTCIE